jgi:hypothetical protein
MLILLPLHVQPEQTADGTFLPPSRALNKLPASVLWPDKKHSHIIFGVTSTRLTVRENVIEHEQLGLLPFSGAYSGVIYSSVVFAKEPLNVTIQAFNKNNPFYCPFRVMVDGKYIEEQPSQAERSFNLSSGQAVIEIESTPFSDVEFLYSATPTKKETKDKFHPWGSSSQWLEFVHFRLQ